MNKNSVIKVPYLNKVFKREGNFRVRFYEVDGENENGQIITLKFGTSTFSTIRKIIKEIALKGCYESILEGLTFNNDFVFLNVIIGRIERGIIDLDYVYVYLKERKTNEGCRFCVGNIRVIRPINVCRLPSIRERKTYSEEEIKYRLEKRREYIRLWQQNNKEKVAATGKKYREKLKALGIKIKRGNTYKDMEKRRLYREKWLKENKDRVKAYHKKYYETHKKKK